MLITLLKAIWILIGIIVGLIVLFCLAIEIISLICEYLLAIIQRLK